MLGHLPFLPENADRLSAAPNGLHLCVTCWLAYVGSGSQPETGIVTVHLSLR
jgi:hypothetical protein